MPVGNGMETRLLLWQKGITVILTAEYLFVILAADVMVVIHILDQLPRIILD